MALVPWSNGVSSKAPNGPFHTRVLMDLSFSTKRLSDLGPISSIISSAATWSTSTWRLGALALNSLATVASTGSRISHFAAFAAFKMSRAVSARSFSHRDLPTSLPMANKNVLAMPPAITKTSTFLTRFPSNSSLEETFAPPTTAITGRSGFSSALVRASSSCCMVRPAKAGRSFASPSVEAWARCAAENASLTKMSPSLASSAAWAGSFFSSAL